MITVLVPATEPISAIVDGPRTVHFGIHSIHNVRLGKSHRSSLFVRETVEEDMLGAALIRDGREFHSDFDSFASWGTPVPMDQPVRVWTTTIDGDTDEAAAIAAAARLLKRNLSNGVRLVDYAVVTDLNGVDERRIHLLDLSTEWLPAS